MKPLPLYGLGLRPGTRTGRAGWYLAGIAAAVVLVIAIAVLWVIATVAGAVFLMIWAVVWPVPQAALRRLQVSDITRAGGAGRPADHPEILQ